MRCEVNDALPLACDAAFSAKPRMTEFSALV
jgi:hypothetical protein